MKKNPKTSSRTTLTQKMEDFCLNYINLGNATQAAIKAGYSERTAQQISAENLSKPVIQARIAQLRQKAEDDSIATVKQGYNRQ